MILEEVIPKLTEYFKLKHGKTVSDCVVYFANYE